MNKSSKSTFLSYNMSSDGFQVLGYIIISVVVLIILCIIGTIHIIIICILHFFNPYLDQNTKDNLKNTDKDMTKFRNKYILGMK